MMTNAVAAARVTAATLSTRDVHGSFPEALTPLYADEVAPQGWIIKKGMPKPRVSAAGGFAALAYTFRKGREAGRHVQALQADALEERLQDVRLWNGWPARRDGQRERLVPGGLQRSRSRRRPGTCRGRSARRSSASTRSRSWNRGRRSGWKRRGAWRSRSGWRRRHALPPHRMGRGARPRGSGSQRRRRGKRPSSTARGGRRTRRRS